MKQRSQEWYAARCGKLTASRVNEALAVLKNGTESAARVNYRIELVAERLTGAPAEKFASPAMRWGEECEPLARAAYEAYVETFVEEVGFIDHPSIDWAGASPDGLVCDEGLIEIKCPNTSTHISWMIAGHVPEEHKNQMLWQMACTGRNWCDFVSYDPRVPPRFQLFIRRFYRYGIEEIEEKAKLFIDSVDDLISELNNSTTNPLQVMIDHGTGGGLQ